MSLDFHRNWLPHNLVINTWDDLKPYYETLKNEELSSIAAFQDFLLKTSELESFVSENYAWRYIKMTCNTIDHELEKNYLYFVNEIQPHIAPYEDKINQKISSASFANELSKNDKSYFIYLRGIEKSIALFKEINIPIQSKIQTLAQQYGTISGNMTVEMDGAEVTLQKASIKLQDPNRSVRENAYNIIAKRRLIDEAKLNTLFNKLIVLRNKIAKNCGFENFRDYKFESLGRFDYNVQDCLNFHKAIQEVVVPLQAELLQERKLKLSLEKLKPFDLSVDIDNKPALKPFITGEELLDKTILCFNKIDPYFGECLSIMKEENLVDLESRIGKAPGGYNYPLAERGKPFIFMNATSSLRDLETMVHEGGHAIHSFLSHPLKLNGFKNCPSEVAELASMSMELISMDGWDVFFANEDDLIRAKISQLEGVISTLPWIATVDAFQHWIYTSLPHTDEERSEAWHKFFDKFSSNLVDYTGYEMYQKNSWQKQLHLYEVPFYYIEYGFAQLGAIAIWKKYKENKQEGIDGYKNFMKLGYTKSIPEIYEAAGIKFDFSAEYVKSLFDFLQTELDALKK